MRVAGVATQPARTAGTHEPLGAGKLRRDRRGQRRIVGEREERLVLRRRSAVEERRPDGSRALGREVRAVEVRAQHAARRRSGSSREARRTARRNRRSGRGGDGAGRRQRRRAVAGVGAADGAERLGGAVHEVGPVAAVDVQVDESRREVRPRRRRDVGALRVRLALAGGDIDNAIVVDHNDRVIKQSIRQDRGRVVKSTAGHSHVNLQWLDRSSKLLCPGELAAAGVLLDSGALSVRRGRPSLRVRPGQRP